MGGPEFGFQRAVVLKLSCASESPGGPDTGDWAPHAPSGRRAVCISNKSTGRADEADPGPTWRTKSL